MKEKGIQVLGHDTTPNRRWFAIKLHGKEEVTYVKSTTEPNQVDIDPHTKRVDVPKNHFNWFDDETPKHTANWWLEVETAPERVLVRWHTPNDVFYYYDKKLT